MRYLTAIFIPPLHYMFRGRWIAAFFNVLVYGIAWVFLLTVIFWFVAPFFWLLATIPALWDLKKATTEETIQKQAEAIAASMAERSETDTDRSD